MRAIGLAIMVFNSMLTPKNILAETLDGSPVTQDADGTRRLGKATLSQHHGIWVMHVFGSRSEMAYQHGVLSSDLIQASALPYFSEKIHRGIAHAYLLRDFQVLRGAVKALVDLMVTLPLESRLTSDDRKTLKAFSKGAGFPEDALLRGFVVPDVGQVLISKVFAKYKVAAGAFGIPSTFGCSTLIQKNSDGMIHARNLDYESYGIFDRFPTVVYTHPSNPSELATISVTSLGLPTAGLTSTNEAGLSFGIHQLMLDRSSTLGRPILSITDEMMRTSHSIDEAVAFLKRQSFSSAWIIIISSQTERRAVAVEVTSGRLEVRNMIGNYLVNTNHVLGTSLKGEEISLNYRYFRDSLARYENLDRLAQKSSRISVQEAVDALSFPGVDNVRGSSEHFGNIDRMNNIQSVVFDPPHETVWVARAPEFTGSKPVHGTYIPLPLYFAKDFDETAFQKRLKLMPREVDPQHGISRETTEAHGLYRLGAQRIQDDGDWDLGISNLEKAMAKTPEDSFFPLVNAFAHFRLAGSDELRRTELLHKGMELLDQAEKYGRLHPYHQQLIHLFRGRYYDLTGKRDLAKAHYARIQNPPSDALKSALKSAQRKAFEPKGLEKISIDFVMGDFFVL